MTIDEIKKLKNAFEADGSIAMGVYFTKEQAIELRRELLLYYGFDNGENLTTFFGMEVMDIAADSFKIE
ncbi:MAG: hypothetical protein HQL71_10635 [Magnetococcales bacterium]|nr:hypothetical protein [Magnetococcales bacterium]